MPQKEERFVKISTDELMLGMFVADVGCGWLRHPWTTKKKLITNRQEIDELIQAGIGEVTIDRARGKSPHPAPESAHGVTPAVIRAARAVMPEEMDRGAAPAAGERRPALQPFSPNLVPMAKELPLAHQTYTRALDVTREMLKDARAGRRIQIGQVQEQVDAMIDSVFRNSDALIALLKLRHYDEYTFTHSLNVTALAVAFGRHLDLDRGELSNLGVGAMFHDLGKTRVPDRILNKPGRLTDEEFSVMKNHALLGVKVLREHRTEVSPEVLDVVSHHHERRDGSGYPDALAGGEISDRACICGLADVYDALSSDRVYHKARPAHEALKIVFSLRDRHFPPEWVDRFIQLLGIYPVGSAVRLTSREIGVVSQVHRESLTRPLVRVVLDPRGRRRDRIKEVDLREPSLSGLEVEAVLDPSSVGLDPASILSA